MKLVAWFICVVSMTTTLISIVVAETTLKSIVHIPVTQWTPLFDIPVSYIAIPVVSFLYVFTLAVLFPVTQGTKPKQTVH